MQANNNQYLARQLVIYSAQNETITQTNYNVKTKGSAQHYSAI